MDLLVITEPAHRLWEIEVKLTLSDWKADIKKGKWTQKSANRESRITRMYYAVPKELADKVPKFVPASTGILAIDGYSRVIRKPKPNLTARPVSDSEFIDLLKSTHYRFWRERRMRAYREGKAEI